MSPKSTSTPHDFLCFATSGVSQHHPLLPILSSVPTSNTVSTRGRFCRPFRTSCDSHSTWGLENTREYNPTAVLRARVFLGTRCAFGEIDFFRPPASEMTMALPGTTIRLAHVPRHVFRLRLARPCPSPFVIDLMRVPAAAAAADSRRHVQAMAEVEAVRGSPCLGRLASQRPAATAVSCRPPAAWRPWCAPRGPPGNKCVPAPRQ